MQIIKSKKDIDTQIGAEIMEYPSLLNELTHHGPNKIVTFTGRYIDPCNPDPSAIHILDIAHALSNVCRFGGHCPSFYSVAEHSVMVADFMERDGHRGHTLLAGLLHDSEEAYLMDIPSPIKRQFPEYADTGTRLRHAIYDSFGIDFELYNHVKPFDSEVYKFERHHLWHGAPTLYPKAAKELFLKRFHEYS